MRWRRTNRLRGLKGVRSEEVEEGDDLEKHEWIRRRMNGARSKTR